jgi:hypothetical protein
MMTLYLITATKAEERRKYHPHQPHWENDLAENDGIVSGEPQAIAVFIAGIEGEVRNEWKETRGEEGRW